MQPVTLTEFRGVKYGGDLDNAWGYSVATDDADFSAQLTSLVDGVRASTVLAGFCYTQLTGTRQEVNGLVDENRVPRLPIDELHTIITG